MMEFARYQGGTAWRCSGRSTDEILSSGVHKAIIFGETAVNPTRMLALADADPTEDHYNRLGSLAPVVGPLGLYFCYDVEMMGPGFIFKNGLLLDGLDLIPTYVAHDVDAGRQWDLKPELGRTAVERPCIVLVSNAYRIYGHWLVDMLPKLWLCQRFLGDLSSFSIIVPRGTPAWALSIMERFFGVTNILWHEINNEVLKLSSCVVPSLLHNDHYFHPRMNDFVSHLLAHPHVAAAAASVRPAERLYITRRAFRDRSTSYSRTIANEEQVVDLMTEFGFTTIAPEELPWEEQIALFSRARIIVGESGSGLHNTIFSPADARVVCLNPENQLQMSIAALRDQIVINQVSPKRTVEASTSYVVDLGRLRRAVAAAIAATDPGRA